MSRITRWAQFAAVVACIGGVAVPRVEAQQPADSMPAARAPQVVPGAGLAPLQQFVDSLSIPPAYVRERFTYPVDGRPNPVEPPASLLASDTYDQMQLSGIVVNVHHAAQSMAMIRMRPTKGTTGVRRITVHVGDKLDEYTVVAITPTTVVLEAHFYGVTTRVTLPHTTPSAPPHP